MKTASVLSIAAVNNYRKLPKYLAESINVLLTKFWNTQSSAGILVVQNNHNSKRWMLSVLSVTSLLR